MTYEANPTPPRPTAYGVCVRYAGRRLAAAECVVERVYADDGRSPLPDFRPQAGGFNWGSGFVGGGPSSAPQRLAYALLFDCLGPTFADAVYPEFARAVVAHLDHDAWSLTREEVRELARACAAKGGVE